MMASIILRRGIVVMVAKLFLVILLVTALSKVAFANYIWDPPTQISHADTNLIVDDIASARVTTATERFHFLLQNPGYGDGLSFGQLLTFPNAEEPPITTWLGLWANQIDFTDQVHPTIDQHVAVDKTGNVHLLYEVRDYDEEELAYGTSLGFKTREHTGWPIGNPIWPDGVPIFAVGGLANLGGYDCGASSPHLFIQDGQDDDPDTLHLTFQNDWCEDHQEWMGYRQTPYEGPADTAVWNLNATDGGDVTWVTDKFARMSYVKDPNGSIVVDPSGTRHFFGEQKICHDTEPDTLRFLHLWGVPPTFPDHQWTTSEAEIDHYEFVAVNSDCEQDDTGGGDDRAAYSPGPGGFATLGIGNYIYLAWNHFDLSTGGREVYFTIIDTMDNDGPFDVINLTGDDGMDISTRPYLTQAADGSIHLAYHDLAIPRQDQDDIHERNIWHMWASDGLDPTDPETWEPENWSTPTRLTVNQRTRSKYPYMHASHDSVWVVYMCHDDNDERDCEPGGDPEIDCHWEAWGQFGHALADSIEAGQTVTWSGFVHLDRDFYVPPTSTLIINPGTTILAKTDGEVESSHGHGIDASRVEIIIRGRIEAIGSEDPITFTSTTEDEETPANDEDNWYGIRFDVPGCGCNEWGVAAGVGELSSLENVHIENALNGVRIENLQAPSLVDVTFDDIENERHIFLADSDAMIPSGYYDTSSCTGTFHEVDGVWNLRPGTHVLTSTNDDEENEMVHELACAGEEHKVDLFVGGLLLVDGEESDPVYFRPEVPTDPGELTAGRDWGGIFLSFHSEGSSIDNADIGYAANPLCLFYPTDQVVSNSTIHHFADTGIWAYGLGGLNGPSLEGLNVERGTDLEETLGNTGISIDGADAADIVDSRIDFSGRRASTRCTGIDLFGFSPALGSGRDFTMESNCIMGPGLGATSGGESDIGVNAEYVRAGSLLSVDISGNKIANWKKVGMFFDHPVNDTLRLNLVANCGRGVDIVHGLQATGPICFRENRFEALRAGATFFAARTDDAINTRFGPEDTSGNDATGLNQFAVHQNLNQTKFIYENDNYPDANDELNAQASYWFKYSAGTFTAISSSESGQVDARLAPPGYKISYSILEGAPYPFLDCSTGGKNRMKARLRIASDTSSNQNPAKGEGGAAFRLGDVYPNPARAGVGIDLTVSEDRLGTYIMEAFDVRGRKVFESAKKIENVGRFVIDWDGRDDFGSAVANGIYFMRIQGPAGLRKVQKVTLVR